MPITHASLETDLRLANILSQEIGLLLADRTSIRTTGAVTYHGSVNGAGSDTVAVRLAGLDGYDAMAAVADGVAATETAITDASATIAVSRYALRRDLTDISEATGMGGSDITVQRLAASAVGEADACFMGLVATAIAGFGATDAGSSGVDMSVDDFFTATSTLEIANNSGPYYALLHPRQLADLQTSIRAEAGALQFLVAGAGMDQSMLSAKGAGYAGSFLGVDIYTSSHVTSSGGNKHGGMWAEGCLGWADSQPLIGFGDTIRPSGSPVTVEIQRSASAALTEVISNAYFGVSVVQDSMGVGIVTDN